MKRIAQIVWTLASTLAGYVGVASILAWLDGAYNVAQGPGIVIVGPFIFTLVGLAPLAAAIAAWKGSRRFGRNRLHAYWAACWFGTALGFPLLILRLFLGQGF